MTIEILPSIFGGHLRLGYNFHCALLMAFLKHTEIESRTHQWCDGVAASIS